MWNNSLKVFRISTSGSVENVIKRHFLSRALAASLLGGAEPFVILEEGIKRNNSVK